MTELGKTNVPVNPVRPENARSPMAVTEFGITEVLQPYTNVLVGVWIIALQLFRLSYVTFAEETDIEVIPLQLWKAYGAM